MHRSARTAQTIRPSRSGSSTMQPATGQAAWQIEHANAPKQRSGSITAMVFGAFLRGPDIILVHIWTGLYLNQRRGWPEGGAPTSGITAQRDTASSKIAPCALVAKKRGRPLPPAGSAAALKALPADPAARPLQAAGAPGKAVASS